MFLNLIESTDHILEISLEQQATIWRQSRSLPTPWAQWNAYINQLCLETCLAWLRSENFPTIQSVTEPALWNLVNGSVVAVDNMRIALIPTEAIDRSELAVQQEWVDIPSFASDYYLGIQVAIDCRSIIIHGYTTHQQLKNQGNYDAQDRTYCLNIDDLIPDLNALWLSYAHYNVNQTRAPLTAILPLDTAAVDRLVARLSNPIMVMPRLEVPFQTWAALLENPEWQEKLCQPQQMTDSISVFTQLNRWLQGRFDEAWQAVDRVLLPQQMATAIRGNISQSTPENTFTDVCRAKILDLDNGQIALLIGISPVDIKGETSSNRINLQIYPAGGAMYLPGETQLRLLNNGNEVGKVNAMASEIIQLQFIVNVGEQFEIEIVCCNQLVQEAFEI
jgi:hypothetical protein